MPDYRYRCTCGKTFVVNTSMKDYKSTQPCPDCNTESERDVSDMCARSLWKCDGSYSKASI